MTFPVHVEPFEGQFAAVLVGAPDVRSVGPSRDEAIAALKNQIGRRVAEGELVTLDVGAAGVAGLAGRYADDPTLRAICTDVYDERNAAASLQDVCWEIGNGRGSEAAK